MTTAILVMAMILLLLGLGAYIGWKLMKVSTLQREVSVAEHTAEIEKRVADVQKDVDRTALRRVEPGATARRLRDGSF